MKKLFLVVSLLFCSILCFGQIRYTLNRRLLIGDVSYPFYSDQYTAIDITIKGNGFFNYYIGKGFGVDLYKYTTPTIIHSGGNGNLVFRNHSLNSYSSLMAAGYLNASDRNLKTNIINFSNGLEVVSKLRPVSYCFINEPEVVQKSYSPYMEDNTYVGLIAQELESVLPALVHTSEDGVKFVDYTSLIAVLIDAVQSLQEEVESLHKQIDSIK